MTDEELISLIDQHVTDALGYDDAISTQRGKAMNTITVLHSVMKRKVVLNL
jgi:hypothetical protein